MENDLRKTWDACGAAFDRFTSAADSFSDNVERPALESLLGDLSHLDVLDLGCGSGVYSSLLATRGARVTGLDLSPAMLKISRSRLAASELPIDLLAADISRPLPFADRRFDLVFTATVLHYVADLAGVIREVARLLTPGGRLVTSVLHPMSTARFPADRGADASPVSWESRGQWPSNYFGPIPRVIETPWLGFDGVPPEGQRLRCFHHTVSDYFAALDAAGLRITHLREPRPPAGFATLNPERYAEALSLPLYLVFAAVVEK